MTAEGNKKEAYSEFFNPLLLFDISKCVPAFDVDKMNPDFWSKVLRLQDALSSTLWLQINSAYRTKEHEWSRGRSGNSQHCFGRAVDISCKESNSRWLLIQKAMEIGFHRILVYPTFIHLDDKPGCMNQVIWMKG